MYSNLFKFSRNLTRLISSEEVVKPLVNLCIRYNYSIQPDLEKKEKFERYQFDFTFDDDLQMTTEMGNSIFWRRKMRTVHNLLDVNKDGIISYDDFKLLADRFVRLGNLPPNQQIEFYEIIKRMWTEQWGHNHPYNLITTEQYIEDMKHVINDKERRKKVHRLLPYLFMAVDKNQNGKISFSEYQLFFKSLGLSYTDAITSFEAIDMDKNGTLTIEEFVKLGRQYFLSDDENLPSRFFWGPLAP